MSHNAKIDWPLVESLFWIKHHPNCTSLEAPTGLALSWISNETLGLAIFVTDYMPEKPLCAGAASAEERERFAMQVSEEYEKWRRTLAGAILARGSKPPLSQFRMFVELGREEGPLNPGNSDKPTSGLTSVELDYPNRR